MWQVDNDRYQLWRLEYELGLKQPDRLLTSVTASDRAEAPRLAPLHVGPTTTAVRRLLKPLCSPFSPAAMMRHVSD